jgi:hypothetical protein
MFDVPNENPSEELEPSFGFEDVHEYLARECGLGSSSADPKNISEA